MRVKVSAMLLAASIGIFYIQPAVLHAETYTCSLDASQAKLYIAPKVVIEIEGKYRDVQVSDALISKYRGDWVAGEIQTSNENRLSLSWELRNLDRDPLENRYRNPSFLYSLTIRKSDLSAVVALHDLLSSNLTYRSTGKCLVEK